MQDSEIIKQLSEAMLKNHESHWALISRLQNKEPWTGEGLPPAGTICEYTDVHGLKWYGCEIIAYHGDHVWLRTTVAQRDHVKVFGAFRFRPLRTAEQIAAEERERAIDEMCQAAEERITDEVAALIYDAGYRKA